MCAAGSGEPIVPTLGDADMLGVAAGCVGVADDVVGEAEVASPPLLAAVAAVVESALPPPQALRSNPNIERPALITAPRRSKLRRVRLESSAKSSDDFESPGFTFHFLRMCGYSGLPSENARTGTVSVCDPRRRTYPTLVLDTEEG